MAWLFLMIAGSFEILGVVLLNELSRTKNKIYVIFLGLAFILSFSTLKFGYCIRYMDRNWYSWWYIDWNDFLWRVYTYK